ncbi:hypothetical protein U876_24210 [Aeromonas hydrophila NJ-35]|uniref:hypothetical protein n=1 Tax=Aeromonas TaxID=642 RepID=UPI000640A4F7|nr:MULTISPECIES: hypothetical protein [Aeromonas]AKJ37126.1 hypothetical protein U876_24210 [Aeromonas hydrophila NJ-35]QGW99197.1 hypothetical protein FGM04_21955 [Aeromonas veronii]HDK8696484.1 hypothetical protein [Aeromonas hydrophila]
MAAMTKEKFLQFQDELERLNLAIAKGEETGDTNSRISELESMMENAPWILIPSEGCLPRHVSS